MRNSNLSRGSGLAGRRATAGFAAAFVGLAGALGGGLGNPVFAADAATLSGIILGVGADETQRIVTWYSSADTSQSIQLTPTARVKDGEFPADASSIAAIGGANVAASGGFNRHATITGLAEHTAYSYRVGAAGNWSPTYSFKTQDFEGDYDFLFYGDPQIGASGNLANDQAGWADTMKVSLAANPDAELLVSGGDQVETAGNEAQWSAFLAPDQLRQYPWAATIGNHDVGSKAYEQHMFTPNTDYSGRYYANGNPASNTSGGDYWFIYKDTLFIDLNSNSYATSQGGGGDEAHLQYVTETIRQHGAKAKWTVLVYHHAIYSPAAHAKDGDAKVRRNDFPTAFSTLGVDLVLQGHDHAYSRSYSIKNGVKENPDEQPNAAEVFPGPGGVIYVTSNSASGSKYYDITKPDASGTNGPDPLKPENYWYNSVQSQEKVRSYTKVKVRNDELVVETVRSQAKGDAPVGSLVDSVTVRPYHGDNQQIQVNVPTAAPGEFGWTIDGYNGLVDLGTAREVDTTYFAASGQINPILVTDTRRSLAPWSISAGVGDFVDGDKSFSGAYLGWAPKVITAGAGAVAGPVAPSAYTAGGDGLSVSRGLASAAQGHERGSAKVGADLDLRIPGEVDKGSYRTTLTITALSS
ncbi:MULTISPECIES: fibronectin type III domain-containing protein [Catenuloplanes]|uniref:Metallophosphoesterase n=1 Tax=Catenuloplanes niger TaxID=587534 RepID=A0AAE3ZKI8_9ACTN|nr:fibronectin type III domain-containing protein [Catenuloplanes niger]MDR7320926.1 hypothetical protein [Catenuloplanes niger]